MAWFTRNLRDSETGKISNKELWARARSAFAVILSVAVLVGGATFVATRVQTAWNDYRTAEDYIGDGVDPVQVTIEKGTPLSVIADQLVAAKVIKTAKAFDREAASRSNPAIQAGRFNLRTELPAKLALDMLLDKANIVRNWMTLTEGQTLDVQLDQAAKATKLPVADFQKAAKDWKKLGLPDWAQKGVGLEGFLYPDTYEVPAEPNATAVLKMAVKQFNKVAKEVDLTGRAQALSKSEKLKLSPMDLVVIASIIEKEVNRDEDRAKVARVIYNRLKIGMPLGLDSTARYASRREGISPTNYKLNSPYNTRINKGVPPSPIGSSGKAALEAAANPADGDMLYFVTVNLKTGETEFSSTDAGFAASRDKYKAWCQESDENKKLCGVAEG